MVLANVAMEEDAPAAQILCEAATPFTMRGYVSAMRDRDVSKCWPFSAAALALLQQQQQQRHALKNEAPPLPPPPHYLPSNYYCHPHAAYDHDHIIAPLIHKTIINAAAADAAAAAADEQPRPSPPLPPQNVSMLHSSSSPAAAASSELRLHIELNRSSSADIIAIAMAASPDPSNIKDHTMTAATAPNANNHTTTTTTTTSSRPCSGGSHHRNNNTEQPQGSPHGCSSTIATRVVDDELAAANVAFRRCDHRNVHDHKKCSNCTCKSAMEVSSSCRSSRPDHNYCNCSSNINGASDDENRYGRRSCSTCPRPPPSPILLREMKQSSGKCRSRRNSNCALDSAVLRSNHQDQDHYTDNTDPRSCCRCDRAAANVKLQQQHADDDIRKSKKKRRRQIVVDVNHHAEHHHHHHNDGDDSSSDCNDESISRAQEVRSSTTAKNPKLTFSGHRSVNRNDNDDESQVPSPPQQQATKKKKKGTVAERDVEGRECRLSVSKEEDEGDAAAAAADIDPAMSLIIGEEDGSVAAAASIVVQQLHDKDNCNSDAGANAVASTHNDLQSSTEAEEPMVDFASNHHRSRRRRRCSGGKCGNGDGGMKKKRSMVELCHLVAPAASSAAIIHLNNNAQLHLHAASSDHLHDCSCCCRRRRRRRRMKMLPCRRRQQLKKRKPLGMATAEAATRANRQLSDGRSSSGSGRGTAGAETKDEEEEGGRRSSSSSSDATLVRSKEEEEQRQLQRRRNSPGMMGRRCIMASTECNAGLVPSSRMGSAGGFQEHSGKLNLSPTIHAPGGNDDTSSSISLLPTGAAAPAVVVQTGMRVSALQKQQQSCQGSNPPASHQLQLPPWMEAAIKGSGMTKGAAASAAEAFRGPQSSCKGAEIIRHPPTNASLTTGMKISPSSSTSRHDGIHPVLRLMGKTMVVTSAAGIMDGYGKNSLQPGTHDPDFSVKSSMRNKDSDEQPSGTHTVRWSSTHDDRQQGGHEKTAATRWASDGPQRPRLAPAGGGDKGPATKHDLGSGFGPYPSHHEQPQAAPRFPQPTELHNLSSSLKQQQQISKSPAALDDDGPRSTPPACSSPPPTERISEQRSVNDISGPFLITSGDAHKTVSCQQCHDVNRSSQPPPAVILLDDDDDDDDNTVGGSGLNNPPPTRLFGQDLTYPTVGHCGRQQPQHKNAVHHTEPADALISSSSKGVPATSFREWMPVEQSRPADMQKNRDSSSRVTNFHKASSGGSRHPEVFRCPTVVVGSQTTCAQFQASANHTNVSGLSTFPLEDHHHGTPSSFGRRRRCSLNRNPAEVDVYCRHQDANNNPLLFVSTPSCWLSSDNPPKRNRYAVNGVSSTSSTIGWHPHSSYWSLRQGAGAAAVFQSPSDVIPPGSSNLWMHPGLLESRSPAGWWWQQSGGSNSGFGVEVCTSNRSAPRRSVLSLKTDGSERKSGASCKDTCRQPWPQFP